MKQHAKANGMTKTGTNTNGMKMVTGTMKNGTTRMKTTGTSTMKKLSG